MKPISKYNEPFKKRFQGVQNHSRFLCCLVLAEVGQSIRVKKQSREQTTLATCCRESNAIVYVSTRTENDYLPFCTVNAWKQLSYAKSKMAKLPPGASNTLQCLNEVGRELSKMLYHQLLWTVKGNEVDKRWEADVSAK